MKVKWIGWMDGMPDYEVDPSMSFSDIIVPTMDTVRAHFLLQLLITNFKPVQQYVIDLYCVFLKN